MDIEALYARLSYVPVLIVLPIFLAVLGYVDYRFWKTGQWRSSPLPFAFWVLATVAVAWLGYSNTRSMFFDPAYAHNAGVTSLALSPFGYIGRGYV